MSASTGAKQTPDWSPDRAGRLPNRSADELREQLAYQPAQEGTGDPHHPRDRVAHSSNVPGQARRVKIRRKVYRTGIRAEGGLWDR